MSWYLGVWRKYATFSGRARRKEYWFFYLFNMIAVVVLSVLDGVLGFGDDGSFGPFYGVYFLAVFVPQLAVTARRLHDSGHRGWWMLVPVANLVLLLVPGTCGPNRFGPDPTGRVAGPPLPDRPAGWWQDPTGRHQLRYHDSEQWTPAILDDGVQAEDEEWPPAQQWHRAVSRRVD